MLNLFVRGRDEALASRNWLRETASSALVERSCEHKRTPLPDVAEGLESVRRVASADETLSPPTFTCLTCERIPHNQHLRLRISDPLTLLAWPHPCVAGRCSSPATRDRPFCQSSQPG